SCLDASPPLGAQFLSWFYQPNVLYHVLFEKAREITRHLVRLLSPVLTRGHEVLRHDKLRLERGRSCRGVKRYLLEVAAMRLQRSRSGILLTGTVVMDRDE